MLLRLIRCHSWPYLRQHRLRTCLTVLGVALGVATVIAISDASESVLASFQYMVRAVAGDSELEVTSPVGKVAESVIAQAAAAPGVRAAAGVVESFLPLADRPSDAVLLLGIDFLGSSIWETQFPRAAIQIPDELGFVNQLDSVVVTRRFAEHLGLRMGDELRVIGPKGVAKLRVRGMLGETESTRLFDGALLVMDLPAAQILLDRSGWVDRVAVQTEPATAREAIRDRLSDAVGTAYEVGAPESSATRWTSCSFPCG